MPAKGNKWGVDTSTPEGRREYARLYRLEAKAQGRLYPSQSAEAQRAWRKANPEKVRKYERTKRERHGEKMRSRMHAYYAANRETILLQKAEQDAGDRESRLIARRTWSTAKARAKRLGLVFMIERVDYPVPEVCPILGIPLDGSTHNNKPSLDRIDNAKGYVPGNVKVISNKANTLKGDLTIELLHKLLAYMEVGRD